MKKLHHVRYLSVSSVAAGLLALSSGALGAGPDPSQFPDYHPNHTVIKCPFIPAGVTPPTCNGLQATCVGTDKDDLILGTENRDVIVALAGNDVVHGDAENDTICGGPGNDSLMGAREDDTLLGEEGDDWLFGAPGADNIQGGPGYDVAWGGPGADKLDGGEGDHDVCMLQKEMGEADASCETIYPPPGYAHEEEPEAGVLKLGKTE
jgi:hypothetical protein